jgi:hypothetical protein
MVVNVQTAREVCARLPLAEACLRLVDLLSHDDFLADLFERYRGRSYEKVISFPTFVQLIADALERWRKTPPRKRRPIKKQTEYLKGGHSSVFRLLQKAKDQKPEPVGV